MASVAVAAVDEKKKYRPLENVLNQINRDYISLSEEHIKRNNEILIGLLGLLTKKMTEKDNLFKEMYTRVFFGGSYYDGLRVGQPDEFDLDLLLTLPKLVNPVLTTSNIPGFIHLQLKDLLVFYKQSDMAARYKGLDKLLDAKHFLDNQKVRQWMEKVVTKSLNDFELVNGRRALKVSQGIFYAKIHKAGPAFTLKVHGNVGGRDILLDIDLVPCFEMKKKFWPSNGFRTNPVSSKTDFFIVPKPMKNSAPVSNRYWRLSFQEQERELIEGKQYLKPSVKILKKLRDTLDHKCMASYYIKTVALWECDNRPAEFWKSSLSYVFITMLKTYQEKMKNGKILYYWNKNNNLLKAISDITLSNMANKLKGIIDDIDRHIDDPTVVARYILSRKEYADFNRQAQASNCPVVQSKFALTPRQSCGETDSKRTTR